MGDTIYDHRVTPPYRLSVFLVDDSPTDRELAAVAFEDGTGRVDVTTFPDGGDLLAALRRPDEPLPDVILIDLNMPGMTGFEVLAALKDDPITSMIPAVILSSSSNEDDVRRAYTLHASSYLIKAVDFEQFVQQIEAFVTYWLGVRTARLSS